MHFISLEVTMRRPATRFNHSLHSCYFTSLEFHIIYLWEVLSEDTLVIIKHHGPAYPLEFLNPKLQNVLLDS